MKSYLRTDEMCKMLGVHYNTLRNWVLNGSIPCHRAGRQYVFDKAEIEAWIESQRVGKAVV